MLVSQATGAGAAALKAGKEAEGLRMSFKKVVYPGSDKREFSRWFLQNKDSSQEIFVAGDPVTIYAYRTACGVGQAQGKPPFCIERLQRSSYYRPVDRGGILVKEEFPEATDLYKDTWGKPEVWTIIPVVTKTKALDKNGNMISIVKDGKVSPQFNYSYRFIELAPGEDIKAFDQALNMKFFQSKEKGIVGAKFLVTKTKDDREYMGSWQLIIKEGDDGSSTPDYIEPQKLFEQILKLSNRVLTDEQKKQGGQKMYFATIDQAYPYATLDQQRQTLQLHAEVLKSNPDFAKRFPNQLKVMTADGALITASATVEDDGAGFDDGGGEAVSLDSAEKGDNEDIDFGDKPAADAETPAAEETPATEAAAETPAAEEPAAEEPVSEEVGEATSDDNQQDAENVDVSGDVSAFDHVNDEPVKPAATATVTKATPAKTVAKPATTQATPAQAAKPAVKPAVTPAATAKPTQAAKPAATPAAAKPAVTPAATKPVTAATPAKTIAKPTTKK